ncbi:calcium-binding protein, partial [Phenylobacterium sp.]|uniref:calcium-binding protein n=1 Tax=Phenylobacterium sp. TaxID=1871053 RepID=UPI0025ED5A91
MALLVAGAAGISVDTLKIDDLLLGTATVATSSAFTLKDGDWLEEFQGQFTYAGNELAGGTVTGWKESFKGNVVFEVSGFSVPVATFVNWANTNDNEAARSTILGGADTIRGSAAADNLRGYAGNDTMTGGDGTNYLRGDEGDDSITGGSGFDDINGNAGNDTCVSGGGDDWVVGGRDNDSLVGSAGQNLVYGNLGNDTCEGGDGTDIVRGGQDNDVLNGGAGDDYVSGDKGSDTVTGGAGADIFHTFGDAGVDRVLDFSLAQGDRVQLDPGTQYTVSQVGADTVIDMTGGGQMVLVGVQMSSLTAGW